MVNKTFNDVKLNMTLKVQSTRANLSSSKEDMAVQMGKIQKWYTDFTPLVFSKKKVDGVTFDQDIIHYATCSTAASTTSKTVDCTGFNLITGAWILVRFTITNTGAVGNLTLNVNNTGAKNIKYRNANLSSAGVLAANRTYMFVYDGTYYQLIGDLDINEKLDSPVDIELGTGVSSTATAFDGSKNITIPVTAIKEAYLTWGGKDFTNNFSPFDAALNPRLGANRMEMTKAAGITIERSTDSGSTWAAVNVSDINKQALMSSVGYHIAVSETSTANLGTDAAKNIMRVTIDVYAGGIYTYLNKFIIYSSTGGCTGCYVKIRIRTQANFSAGNDTWATWDRVNRNWSISVTESNARCPISGFSGFNVINPTEFITYGQGSHQYRNIQFIFGCETNTSTYAGMEIISIQGYGGVGWAAPSTMARTGHLYSYDGMGAATFPSTISASGGTLTGSLVIKGTAASKPLITRGIYGSDGNGNTGDLYIQFTQSGSIGKTYFGGETYYISADGSTYNGSAAKVNGHTVEKNVPSDAVFTDTKVTQTNTTGSAAYRVLLSGNANDTTETTTARKSANLQFNPSTGILTQSGATFGGIIITRSGSANGASIAFKNTNGILGYIGFTGNADTSLQRWPGSDTNTRYTIHDTSNTSYTATVTSSTSGQYTIGTLKLGGSNVTIYGKDTVYTHPSGFTAKTTAGFYKYTVDTNGHVSAGAALTKSDITSLGIASSDHTHDYIPLSGSDNISGRLAFNTTGIGIYGLDKQSHLAPLIVHNAANLWIGQYNTDNGNTAHYGGTYISTGIDVTDASNPVPFDTINIVLPNGDNQGSYATYHALHSGNTSFTRNLSSGTKIGTIKIDNTSTDIYCETNTDHITTATTSGTGNAVTSITADANGALAVVKGATFSLSNHTHDTLVSKTLTTETIDDTSGNFFFKGDNLFGNVYDWVGIQADAGNDKFQLVANDNRLMFRHNDETTTDPENWNDWVGLLTPADVTGNNGITVTEVDSNIGTGDTAFTYNRSVRISHSNSVSAVTTAAMLKVGYDAQGHITGSSPIAKSDITGLGIASSDHTHSEYLGAVLNNSSSYYGMADPDGTDTNWIRTTTKGIIPYESGALGSGHSQLGTSTFYFSASYIDSMYANIVNITGTTPRLKFRQTTSGSEYNSNNAGITCYPGTTNGMIMTIQSGGNMIIGSGEFPTNFYTRFTNEDSTLDPAITASGETTYIGSDGAIHLISNANSIGTTGDTSHYIWTFSGSGELLCPKGGHLVIQDANNYSATIQSGTQTSNVTLTLPNKTGTFALTSDLPDIVADKATSDIYSKVPYIGASGDMEIGKYLDFHNSNTTAVNYDVRLYTNSATQLLFKTLNNTAGSNFSPSTTNTFDLGTSSLKWGNVYATNFKGMVDYVRHCYARNETALTSKWVKIATVTSTTTNDDRMLVLLVSNGYTSAYQGHGILRCRLRSGSTIGTIHTLSLSWDYITNGLQTPVSTTALDKAWSTTHNIDPSNFVAVYTATSGTSLVCDIWVKITVNYQCWTFTVLNDAKRASDVWGPFWTLSNYANTGGQDSLPSGTGQVVSKVATLYGINDNPEWVTLTNGSQLNSVSELKCKKQGNIVYIKGMFGVASTTGTITPMAVLPDGYYATDELRHIAYSPLIIGGSPAAGTGDLQINTTGTMNLYTNNSSTFTGSGTNSAVYIMDVSFML